MAKPSRVFTFYDNMDFPTYSFKEFPKMLYAAHGDTHVVQDSAEEEKYLAQGWFDHPGKAAEAKPEDAEVSKLSKATEAIEAKLREEFEARFKAALQEATLKLAKAENAAMKPKEVPAPTLPVVDKAPTPKVV